MKSLRLGVWGDWSPPPAVRDEGGRNVGNRKERHVWRDYASFPDWNPPTFSCAKRPKPQVEQPPQAALSTALTLLEAGLKQERNEVCKGH